MCKSTDEVGINVNPDEQRYPYERQSRGSIQLNFFLWQIFFNEPLADALIKGGGLEEKKKNQLLDILKTLHLAIFCVSTERVFLYTMDVHPMKQRPSNDQPINNPRREEASYLRFSTSSPNIPTSVSYSYGNTAIFLPI